MFILRFGQVLVFTLYIPCMASLHETMQERHEF